MRALALWGGWSTKMGLCDKLFGGRLAFIRRAHAGSHDLAAALASVNAQGANCHGRRRRQQLLAWSCCSRTSEHKLLAWRVGGAATATRALIGIGAAAQQRGSKACLTQGTLGARVGIPGLQAYCVGLGAGLLRGAWCGCFAQVHMGPGISRP
jgi:hypothetical protein